jgi:hypothetical protein
MPMIDNRRMTEFVCAYTNVWGRRCCFDIVKAGLAGCFLTPDLETNEAG